MYGIRWLDGFLGFCLWGLLPNSSRRVLVEVEKSWKGLDAPYVTAIKRLAEGWCCDAGIVDDAEWNFSRVALWYGFFLHAERLFTGTWGCDLAEVTVGCNKPWIFHSFFTWSVPCFLFRRFTGDRDYVFRNVPSFLNGGLYVGSRTWPKAGTWTIEYEAPTILYVVVEMGEYNAGVDDVLSADGWVREEVGEFCRWNSRGNNPLGVWSRHFEMGSSYSTLEDTQLLDTQNGGIFPLHWPVRWTTNFSLGIEPFEIGAFLCQKQEHSLSHPPNALDIWPAKSLSCKPFAVSKIAMLFALLFWMSRLAAFQKPLPSHALTVCYCFTNRIPLPIAQSPTCTILFFSRWVALHAVVLPLHIVPLTC